MNISIAEEALIKAVKHYIRTGQTDADEVKDALRYLGKTADAVVDTMSEYHQAMVMAHDIIDACQKKSQPSFQGYSSSRISRPSQ